MTTTTSTRTPLWRAACDACPWSQDAPTYRAAGEAARGHSEDCPEASTTVQPIPGHTPHDADALAHLDATGARLVARQLLEVADRAGESGRLVPRSHVPGRGVRLGFVPVDGNLMPTLRPDHPARSSTRCDRLHPKG